MSVFNYLTELAHREERNRSYCINRIVREHAAREGTPLPSSDMPAPERAAWNGEEH